MQVNFQDRCCRIHFIFRERLVNGGKNVFSNQEGTSTFCISYSIMPFISIKSHFIFLQKHPTYPCRTGSKMSHPVMKGRYHKYLHKLPFLQIFHGDAHVTYSLEMEKICIAFIHPPNSA